MRSCEGSEDDDVKERSTGRREEGEDVRYVFGGGERRVQRGGVEWEDCAVGCWVTCVEGVVGYACQEREVG